MGDSRGPQFLSFPEGATRRLAPCREVSGRPRPPAHCLLGHTEPRLAHRGAAPCPCCLCRVCLELPTWGQGARRPRPLLPSVALAGEVPLLWFPQYSVTLPLGPRVCRQMGAGTGAGSRRPVLTATHRERPGSPSGRLSAGAGCRSRPAAPEQTPAPSTGTCGSGENRSQLSAWSAGGGGHIS